MDVPFLLHIAPKTCLTILGPICCLAFYLTLRVLRCNPASERKILLHASAGASFCCGVALLIVIVNYNVLDALSIYTLLLRAHCLVFGLVMNDFVIIMRMRSLSDNKLTPLIVFTVLFCVIKHVGGVMLNVTLYIRISSGDAGGLSLPVQRLILHSGEMATSLCYIVFWFRLLRSQPNKASSKDRLGLFLMLIKTNIVFSSIAVIILWSLCIYTDWTYGVVFDFFMMPAYFFVLCPSAILTIAKDRQVKISKELSKTVYKTAAPVEL